MLNYANFEMHYILGLTQEIAQEDKPERDAEFYLSIIKAAHKSAVRVINQEDIAKAS